MNKEVKEFLKNYEDLGKDLSRFSKKFEKLPKEIRENPTIQKNLKKLIKHVVSTNEKIDDWASSKNSDTKIKKDK
jgi:hypothetical protein